MLDIGKILKRAWHILWNYKVMWIFGILLAITTGGSGGGNNGGGSRAGLQTNYNFPGVNQHDPLWIQQLNAWFQQNIEPMAAHPERYIATFVWIGVGLLLFVLITGAITDLIRYVSEAAVLRMVDGYEQTGTKAGFKQGWRLGWSRAAFRLWLIDLLVIALPVFLFVLILIGTGIGVFSYASSHNTTTSVVGLVIAALAFSFFTLAFVLLMVFVSLLREFFVRKAALEGQGVIDSIRAGWQMFKRDWKNAALMWLVIVGLRIGFLLVSLILIVVLIPVLIITGIAGLVVAAIPGVIAFGITSLFAGGPWTWIIAIVVGAPFFALVFGSPFLLIGGWVKIFISSTWTLTFRELKALENLTMALPPEAK
jgi:hypothetical protein